MRVLRHRAPTLPTTAHAAAPMRLGSWGDLQLVIIKVVFSCFFPACKIILIVLIFVLLMRMIKWYCNGNRNNLFFFGPSYCGQPSVLGGALMFINSDSDYYDYDTSLIQSLVS